MIIKGKVFEIIYRNDANGYTVMTLNVDQKSVDAIGIMPFVNEGDEVEVEGAWVEHPVYGDQFKVEKCDRLEPSSEAAIVVFLASGVIGGIGEATARKMVKHFGVETLHICAESPYKLAEIRGISHTKALKIGAEYNEFLKMEQLLKFLGEYSISATVAARLNRDLGNFAIDMIKDNPYLLVAERYGVDFSVADKIAFDAGKDKDCLERLMSGIEYVMKTASDNGHVYCPKKVLFNKAYRLLKCDYELLKDALSQMEEKGKIEIDDEKVYLPHYFEAEAYVANKLLQLDAAAVPFEDKQVADILKNIETNQGFELAELQTKAVMETANSGVLVITGGPGTGKTTIIRTIISLFERFGLEIKLAAPTGRAAKRMKEATGKDASTIHRLLELVYSETDDLPIFMKNEASPLEAEAIIIDEASMVDILLMQSLLKATELGTRIILVGDANQLPSVGAGDVLRDIIKSQAFNCVEFEEVFRQAGESMIVTNAHKIRMGEELVLNAKGKDFFFINETGGAGKVAEVVADVCARRLPDTYGYDVLKDIQVITPTRKGETGVVSMNSLMHKSVSTETGHNKTKLSWNGVTYRVGDKVMQIKNNYQIEWERYGADYENGLGVFNGDMGIVDAIDEANGKLLVKFDDDRLVWYDKTVLDDIEWAYAVTVHKSQGSEFPAVVIPMVNVHPMLMYRNLIYTGVTRAKELVVVVGEIDALYRMIKNNREESRYTTLKKRLCEIVG